MGWKDSTKITIIITRYLIIIIYNTLYYSVYHWKKDQISIYDILSIAVINMICITEPWSRSSVNPLLSMTIIYICAHFYR